MARCGCSSQCSCALAQCDDSIGTFTGNGTPDQPYTYCITPDDVLDAVCPNTGDGVECDGGILQADISGEPGNQTVIAGDGGIYTPTCAECPDDPFPQVFQWRLVGTTTSGETPVTVGGGGVPVMPVDTIQLAMATWIGRTGGPMGSNDRWVFQVEDPDGIIGAAQIRRSPGQDTSTRYTFPIAGANARLVPAGTARGYLAHIRKDSGGVFGPGTIEPISGGQNTFLTVLVFRAGGGGNVSMAAGFAAMGAGGDADEGDGTMLATAENWQQIGISPDELEAMRQ